MTLLLGGLGLDHQIDPTFPGLLGAEVFPWRVLFLRRSLREGEQVLMAAAAAVAPDPMGDLTEGLVLRADLEDLNLEEDSVPRADLEDSNLEEDSVLRADLEDSNLEEVSVQSLRAALEALRSLEEVSVPRVAMAGRKADQIQEMSPANLHKMGVPNIGSMTCQQISGS